MMPSIGVVIATPGRSSIYRTLCSIVSQGLQTGDDVLVVGDGFHAPTKKLVEAFGFKYEATEITRDWGHSQSNYGVKKVGGDLLVYNDDDDIFAPRAFDEIRALATKFPNAPIMGRVKTPFRGLLWNEASPNAMLDGHCLVIPNVKDKLGFFTKEYAGDQAWIKTCLEPYENLYWADRVWTLTRPTWLLFPHILHKDDNSELVKGLSYAPGLEGRLFTGSDDWCWVFYRHAGKESFPVAIVKMWREEERMLAAYSYNLNIGNCFTELAEFMCWAAQGLDCWVYVKEEDEDMIEALNDIGYQKHTLQNGIADYIHNWPPNFWQKKEPVKKIIAND